MPAAPRPRFHANLLRGMAYRAGFHWCRCKCTKRDRFTSPSRSRGGSYFAERREFPILDVIAAIAKFGQPESGAGARQRTGHLARYEGGRQSMSKLRCPDHSTIRVEIFGGPPRGTSLAMSEVYHWRCQRCNVSWKSRFDPMLA